MVPSADDKKYATDTRLFKDATIADGIFENFEASPIIDQVQIKDICIYKPGDLNKIGKEGVTSWDSFSYAIMMGHNVWMHVNAVQEANRQYDAGNMPAMLRDRLGHFTLRDLIDKIFAQKDRKKSLDLIDHYHDFWMNIKGTRGFTGKKQVNSHTHFNNLFDFGDSSTEEVVDDNSEISYNNDTEELDLDALDQLENEQEK
jgi:hypothetical protein